MRKAVCCSLLLLVLILGISDQSYASLHLSSESANSLSGYMQDPAGGSRVLFWAAYENSRLTIRVQFIDYTLELIKGGKELYVTADSEDRLTRSISTSEKGSLDKLAVKVNLFPDSQLLSGTAI